MVDNNLSHSLTLKMRLMIIIDIFRLRIISNILTKVLCNVDYDLTLYNACPSLLSTTSHSSGLNAQSSWRIDIFEVLGDVIK